MQHHGELLSMCLEDIPGLRRQGMRWLGRCPLHPDHEPSFYVGVHQGREYFKCFGQSCGKSGGVATYRRLTGRTGGTRHQLQPLATDYYPTLETPPAAVLADANRYFISALPKSQTATSYLKRRGIEAVDYARLGVGYCPHDEGLYAHLTGAGHDRNLLLRWGLIRPRSKCPTHHGRITIAHRTPHLPDHDLSWYTARSVRKSANHARYLHPVGPRPPLLSPPRPGKAVILVEGPFDMLALRIAGFRVAAVNGHPEARNLGQYLQGAGIAGVMLMPDRDPPGQQWAERMASVCRRARMPCLLLELPPLYEDPGQLPLGGDARGTVQQMVEIAKRKRYGV